MPACNGRFGAMAAVTPQTILCKLERYYPAASSVEAATAPSRWDVVCNLGESAVEKVTSRKRNTTRQRSGKSRKKLKINNK